MTKLIIAEGEPLSIQNFEQAIRFRINAAGPKDTQAAYEAAADIISCVARIVPRPEYVQRSIFAAFEVLCRSDAVGVNALQRALGRLSQERPVPLLLLRLLLECTRQQRGLGQFVCQQVMPTLVQNQIWTEKALWPGFIQLAKKYSTNKPPNCLPTLLSLPMQLLAQFLKIVPDAKISLAKHVSNQPHMVSPELRKLLEME